MKTEVKVQPNELPCDWKDYNPFGAFFERMVELGHIEVDEDTGVYTVVNIREVNRILFGE